MDTIDWFKPATVCACYKLWLKISNSIPSLLSWEFVRRASKRLLFNVKIRSFSAISWWEQVTFLWDDDDVHFVLDHHA